jgi:hypothetical protein
MEYEKLIKQKELENYKKLKLKVDKFRKITEQ